MIIHTYKTVVIGQSYTDKELVAIGAQYGNHLYEHETQDELGKSAIHISCDFGKHNMWFIYNQWTKSDSFYKCVYKQ